MLTPQPGGSVLDGNPGSVLRGNQQAEPFSRATMDELDDLRASLTGVSPSYTTSLDLRIPRMDMSAPIRWPTLLHEIAHKDCDERVQSFQDFLGLAWNNIRSELKANFFGGLDDGLVDGHIINWIRELVCDQAAFDVVGPALFFSQLYAFESDTKYLSRGKAALTTHPPALLRLQLLQQQTDNHFLFEDTDLKSFLLREMGSRVAYIRWLTGELGAEQDPASYTVLRKAFEAWSVSREKKRYPVRLQDVEELRKQFKAGIPATQRREPADIGAILLSGAMLEEEPFDVVRSDEAIRRSLQYREWIVEFGELSKGKPQREASANLQEDAASDQPSSTSLLVDWEIRELLQGPSSALVIAPLLDESRQLGSASIDLRLGHYFELFPEGASRVVDLVQENLILSNSREIGVDIGKGVIISPGRFVLGHTLEFIKLPSNVCGQIEGRSSFGRLGIQVHMTANLIDSGFSGVITLEILNMGPDPVRLYPGVRIAQLRLFRTQSPTKPYSQSNKYSGRYRHSVSNQGNDAELDILRRLSTKRPGSFE